MNLHISEDKIKDFMKNLNKYLIDSIQNLFSIDTSNQEKKIHKIPQGTSCLIKQDEKGVIFIAKRRKNLKTIKAFPNCVYITNVQRECFFQDLRDNNVKNNPKRQRYAIYRDTNQSLYESYEALIEILYQKQKGE